MFDLNYSVLHYYIQVPSLSMSDVVLTMNFFLHCVEDYHNFVIVVSTPYYCTVQCSACVARELCSL